MSLSLFSSLRSFAASARIVFAISSVSEKDLNAANETERNGNVEIGDESAVDSKMNELSSEK
jgi:hypothetical protein